MIGIILLSTIVCNGILVTVLLFRGWSGRLQWFTLTTILAVIVDCLFHFIHGFAHQWAAPMRIFVQYWLFPLLFLRCAWEAHRVRISWLEYLLLIQVGLAAVACAAHLHGDKWTIYRIEIFNIYFNIAGILSSIFRLRGEPRYEP